MERLKVVPRLVQAVTLLGAVSLGVLADTPTAALADSCQYKNGFAQAAALNPDIPACKDDEHKNNITGRMEQNTLNNGRLEWDGVNIIFTMPIGGPGKIINLTPPTAAPVAPNPDASQQANQCTIEGSFNYFEIARPDIVGRCLENAHPDSKSPDELLQTTTKGELRQRGGLSYFTNGQLTYLLGNRAIYQRPIGAYCPGEAGAPANTPTCKEVPLQINHIYTQESAVVLTLDDGWSREADEALLDAIVSTGNSATIMVNSRYYRAYRDLFLKYDQTGQIYFGNHTENHADLGILARNGNWGQINSEILNGDPQRAIPELKHATKAFRFPGFSDGSSNYDANSELRRKLVFDYGLTILNSDQGDYDYTTAPQSYINLRITSALPGQIVYGHFLPRNIASFRSNLIALNQKGIKAENLNSMLNKSLVRTI